LYRYSGRDNHLNSPIKKVRKKMSILDLIVAKIEDPAIKSEVVKKWNASVNIPILSEATEASIMEAIYDVVIECLVHAVRK